MSFETTYLEQRAALDLEAGRLVDALEPLAPRRNLLETSYEWMDAAIFHILQPSDVEGRQRVAKSAFRELLINRNLDHVPEYAAGLSDYLDVVDPECVLDQASRGRQFLFAGFHTGPYWAVFQKLVARGLAVTTLFPGALESKRQEIQDVFAAVRKHYKSQSTLQLISLDDPNFLVHIRSSKSAGRQLVVFLDGNSGVAFQANSKRDVELDFFHARVRLKTTILRLADILGMPLVTFNAVRRGIDRTLFLDPPLQNAKATPYEHVVSTIFERLFSRLREEPAQWEGWLYFHTYFSPSYLASLGSAEQTGGQLQLEKKSRYFLQQREDATVLFDKQTYTPYRVTKKQGANADGQQNRIQ